MLQKMSAIGTTDSAFHDGNPSTGELGTIVTADWLNAVQASTMDLQDELLNVLAAASIGNDPAVKTQILAAIKKLIADSAGSDQNAIISTASSLTIPIGARGSFYQFTGSAAAAWEFPTPVGHAGAKYTVWNNGTAPLAVTTPAGYFYGSTISGQYASYGIPNGDVCIFESDGYNWINIINSMVSPTGSTLMSSPALTDNSKKVITSGWLKSIFGAYSNKAISASTSSLATSVSFTAPSNGVVLLISQGYIAGSSSQTLAGPTITAANATIVNTLLNFNMAISQFGVASGLLTVTANAAVTVTATMTNGAAGAANVQLIAVFIPTV